MPTFEFGIFDGKAIFEKLPREVVEILKHGFSTLAALSAELYPLLLETAVTTMVSKRINTDTTSALKQLAFPEKTTAALLSAASLVVVSTRGDEAVAPEQFLRSAQKAGVLNDSDAPGVMSFATFVSSSRATWSDKVDRSELGQAILPSLTAVKAAVDMRMRFDENDIVKLTVPVAILRFDTDSDADLSCQATEWELASIIDALQQTLRRLKAVSTKTTPTSSLLA